MEISKLRTLKEIEEDCIDASEPGWSKSDIFDNTRAEAVKLRKLDKEGFKKYLNVNYIDLNAMFILTLFIEYFFNLTEEDLE